MTDEQRLKELRTKKGLSQYRLSQLSGVTQSYISKYERGDSCVSFELLKKLLPHLGVSVSEFLSETDHQVDQSGAILEFPKLDEKKEALLRKVIADVQDLEYEGLVAVDALVRGLKEK